MAPCTTNKCNREDIGSNFNTSQLKELHEDSCGFNEGKLTRMRFSTKRTWDKWLRFHDVQLEDEFWSSHVNGSLLLLDRIMMVQGTVQLIIIWSILVSEGKTDGVLPVGPNNWDYGLFLILLCWTEINLFRKTNFYIQNRTFILGLMRVMLSFIGTKYCDMLPPPEASQFHFWIRMLTKSNLPNHYVLPLMLQLQFKPQLFVCGISWLIGMSWSSIRDCQAWFETADYVAVLNTIGEHIEKTIVRISFVPTKMKFAPVYGVLRRSHSCWLIMAFIYSVIGFYFPAIFVYVVELCSRVKFLASKREYVDEAGKPYSQIIWEGIFMAAWIFVLMSIVSWITLHVFFGTLLKCCLMWNSSNGICSHVL